MLSPRPTPPGRSKPEPNSPQLSSPSAQRKPLLRKTKLLQTHAIRELLKPFMHAIARASPFDAVQIGPDFFTRQDEREVLSACVTAVKERPQMLINSRTFPAALFHTARHG